MNKKLVASTGALMLTMTLSGVVGAGVQGSKHDLSVSITEANGEVCVFCHTPHGADTNAGAPLWNKALPDSTSYTRYSSLGTATLDGAEADVGSVSLACLSCHDGSQAVDVVINKPGSGGYVAAGSELSTTSGSNLSGAPIPMLGTDLQNDHPISIQYAGGACNTAADCDPQLQATGDPDFMPVVHASINSQDAWWVDTDNFSLQADGANLQSGTPNVREKTDMILYARDFSGTTGPSVECASCHDPHEDTARPVSFMRIANANSGVCLACHIK